MRSIITFCFALISVISVAQDSHYGEQIDKNNIVKSSAIPDLLGTNESVDLKLQGEIITTCAKKGCWMTMKLDNGTEMRVTFKDYGFFVPTEGVVGNPAIIQGEIKKEVTDVETLKHYAEDEGKSTEEISLITEPVEEYTFVATGVIIESKDK